MPEWVNEFEHASVTTENREAFTKHMEKFPTQADCVANHMELSKQVGKPFRMPESMDKLPDDASRNDFAAQAHKLLGIQHAASVDDLKALDLKAGGAENVDENIANAFKQFVVDKKMPISLAQESIGFINELSVQARKDAGVAAEAAKEQAEADVLTQMGVVNGELEKLYKGGKDEVATLSAQFKKAFTMPNNKFGLNADDAEEVGQAMVDSGLLKNTKLTKIMLDTFAPFGAEGSTDGGAGGNPQPKKATVAEQLPKTGKALGWNT